jgi:Na+/H+-dicarboxylate symporter
MADNIATETTDDLDMLRLPRFLTASSIVGLSAGLALGAVASASPHPAFEWLGSVLGPVGTVWTNALKAIVIPLVVSFLILATSGDGVKGAARLGALTFSLCVAFLVAAAVFALALGPPLFQWLPTDPGSLDLAAVSATQSELRPAMGADPRLGFGDWLVSLFPSNPIRAAADGDILGVVVLSVVFGLAIGRIGPEGRRLIDLFRAVRNATLVVTAWILWVLPLAAFALAFGVAATNGFSLAGAIGYWLLLHSGMLILLLGLLYPTTALLGRISIARFARGVWPSQTVAVATRSSLATLPALVQAGEQRLRLPSDVVGLTLPLAVSTFKINLPLTSTLQFLFLAHLLGISLAPGFLLVFITTRILLTFSQPGLPAGSFMLMLPFYLAAGIPVEAIVLVKIVNAIPDVFATTLNVTADMSVGVIVARLRGWNGEATGYADAPMKEAFAPARDGKGWDYRG